VLAVTDDQLQWLALVDEVALLVVAEAHAQLAVAEA
jgi:hypothetical protein